METKNKDERRINIGLSIVRWTEIQFQTNEVVGHITFKPSNTYSYYDKSKRGKRRALHFQLSNQQLHSFHNLNQVFIIA